MPKCGLFRPDRVYQAMGLEQAGRAMACLYALHGYMLKREGPRRRKRRPRR